MDDRRFLKALARFGWRVVSQRGSHRKLAHPDSNRIIIVAFNGKIRRPAMKKTLNRVGINEDEFIKHL